jgi:hypothetical protein
LRKTLSVLSAMILTEQRYHSPTVGPKKFNSPRKHQEAPDILSCPPR